MMQVKAKVNYKEVLKGDRGFHYTPKVNNGILSWSNDGGMKNPTPVNIKGDHGERGERGYHFTPVISEDGVLSWCNNGGLINPDNFDIKNLIIDEVKDARIGIRGEQFNNLSDRLNVELTRLDSKLEIVKIHSDFKHNHNIPSTVDGMTINSVIKGESVLNKKISSFGDINNKISILTKGKNLCPINTFNVVTERSVITKVPLNIKFNTDYCCSTNRIRIACLLSNVYVENINNHDELHSRVVSGGKGVEIILSATGEAHFNSSNYKYCYLTSWIEVQANTIIENIMLEEGKNKTPFKPYQEDKKDILLPFQGGLKGFSGVYDSIDKVITQRLDIRDYIEGDEELEHVMTDGEKTIYVLDAPIIHNINYNIDLKSFDTRTYINIADNELGYISFDLFVHSNDMMSYLFNREYEILETINYLKGVMIYDK